MTVFREFASAKINLTLEVLGRRADGYHELQSLVAFARDVGDVITLDTSKPSGIATSGPFAASIAGANLVEVALRRLRDADPDLQLGAVHLEKNLPVAAGIGGGSADAAAVIRAVMGANPDRWSNGYWDKIAVSLGADVPVCVVSRLSWMLGVGELVTPVDCNGLPGFFAVIANPLVPVPADKTAQVFKSLSAAPLPSTFEPAPPFAPKSAGDLLGFVHAGTNTLEAAARRVVPEVSQVLGALAALKGCRFARMSGGGPTCFALFDTPEDATTAALVLKSKKPEWWIEAATLR